MSSCLAMVIAWSAIELSNNNNNNNNNNNEFKSGVYIILHTFFELSGNVVNIEHQIIHPTHHDGKVIIDIIIFF